MPINVYYYIIIIIIIITTAPHLIEEESELSFGLPHPLAEAVGPLAHEEGHLFLPFAALVGQSPGHQGFASP